jgi:sugar phosphate isomerase/epimerase
MAADKAKCGLIGIVGEEAKADFWGTMKKVADIGYQGIEGAEALLSLEGGVEENLKRFHDLGLKVLTVSAGREALRDDLAGVIKKAKALQSPRVSCWWAPMDSKEAILKDAELYNEAGAKLAAEGLTLCYHNHDQEFKNVFDGVYALDLLAANTDPKALAFELDVAWISIGGEDPVTVLNRYKGRVPAVHVKDVYGLHERTLWTAVGTGVVKVKESVRAAIDQGIEWVVVEQDKLRNLSPIETITVSYLNLKEPGLVE